MTRRWHDALGKVFEAEIDSALRGHPWFVHQSKAKVYSEMQAKGLCAFVTIRSGRDALGPIEVKGWALTEHGRFLYCQQCEHFHPEVADPVEAPSAGGSR